MNVTNIELTNDSQFPDAEKEGNTQKVIYCLSGLGADSRIFQKLKFQDCRPIHICW